MMTKSISKKAGRFSVLALAVLVAFVIMPAVSYGAQTHKEMKLTVASYIPVGYPVVYEGQTLFVDMVNKKGKGIVQLNTYWGGTLLKGREILPGLQAGTADIIFHTGAYLLGSYPIIGVQILPVWDGLLDSFEGLKIGSPLYKLQNDIMRKKNLFQLVTSGVVPEFLWTRNKLVRSPEDMKGLKIRCAGKVEAKVLQILGAAPVVMPSAELPQALQRGVVDGALINPWTATGRGTEEFCKYMIAYPFTCQGTPVYILWDKWNSWPEDVRKVLMDVAREWDRKYVSGKESIAGKRSLKSVLIPYYEKKGMKTILLNKNEREAFDMAIGPVIDWWVKQVGEDVGRKALKYTTKYKK